MSRKLEDVVEMEGPNKEQGEAVSVRRGCSEYTGEVSLVETTEEGPGEEITSEEGGAWLPS